VQPLLVGEVITRFERRGLHLVALKLHATRTWERAVQGKDFYDILNLIRTSRMDTTSAEFREILDRYATPRIKERLLRDLAQGRDEHL